MKKLTFDQAQTLNNNKVLDFITDDYKKQWDLYKRIDCPIIQAANDYNNVSPKMWIEILFKYCETNHIFGDTFDLPCWNVDHLKIRYALNKI